MFIVGFLSWWYTAGWRQRFVLLRQHMSQTADYFSIDLLLRTFFSPFRQISAGKVRGSFDVQLRAFFDNLISRVIGAFVRGFLVVIGTLWMMIVAIFGGILALLWVVVPLLPIVGIVLALSGWVPWRL